MIELSKKALHWRGGGILGLLVGIAGFFLVIPGNVLAPSNIGWLGLGEDTKTYYLGWDFFRRHGWTWPISQNPLYGLEISGSVFMADVVPLFAFIFKGLRGWLPDIFQYHGLWLLVCFALQGLLGWMLAGLISRHWVHKIAVSALFIFQAPFLARALGHQPLMAQFLILAGLYICIRKNIESRWLWVLMAGVAASINAYLLLMVLGLWFADYCNCYLASRRLRLALHEAASLFSVVAFMCWQVGYFSVGEGVVAYGNPYGLYRFNLLSFIDSDGWSLILKDIPGGPGDYEGFAYLGLGVIFLAAFFLFALFSGDAGFVNKIPGNKYLYVVLGIFFVYAITNNVGLGPFSLNVPLPSVLLKYTAIFRGAGRFVWPVLYFLVFVFAYGVAKAFSNEKASWILLGALLIQITDLGAGWYERKRVVGSAYANAWTTELKNGLWQGAASRYSYIRRLPAINAEPGWSSFADLAARHGLGTDSVYLARVNYSILDELNKKNRLMIDAGRYDENTFYVVNPRWVARVLRSANHQADCVAELDGHVVVFPGKGKFEFLEGRCNISYRDYVGVLKSGVWHSFVDGPKASNALLAGWSEEVGVHGIWSDAASAMLAIPIEKDQSINSLVINGTPFVAGGIKNQKVLLKIGGDQVREFVLENNAVASLFVELSDSEKRNIAVKHEIELHFDFPNAQSPRNIGLSADDRTLAFAIKEIKVKN